MAEHFPQDQRTKRATFVRSRTTPRDSSPVSMAGSDQDVAFSDESESSSNKPSGLEADHISQKFFIRLDTGEVKGRDLFSALCASLLHVLCHDGNAFNRKNVSGGSDALRHLLEPQVIRNFLCDQLSTSFQNTPDMLLQGLNPREYVLLRYTDAGIPIPSSNEDIAPPSPIRSFEDYVRAMRLPNSVGDVVMIAAFIEYFDLSCIFLDNAEPSTPLRAQGSAFRIALTLLASFCDGTLTV